MANNPPPPIILYTAAIVVLHVALSVLGRLIHLLHMAGSGLSRQLFRPCDDKGQAS